MNCLRVRTVVGLEPKSPLYKGFAMLSPYDNRRKRGYQDYHGHHLAGTTWQAMATRRVQAPPPENEVQEAVRT
jgi:hypothetical protein